MRYRYRFVKICNKELFEKLRELGVDFTILEENGSTNEFKVTVVFDLFDDMSGFSILMNELEKLCVKYITKYPVYTNLEYDQALYFWILPKRQSIDVVNVKKTFVYGCKYKTSKGHILLRHEEQIGDIHIKKEPPFRAKTAIWGASVGQNELFADKRVYSLVEEYGINGVSFRNVILRNGQFSDRLFQINASTILKNDVLGKGFGEKVIYCPMCGNEQYVIDSSYKLHIDFSKVDHKIDFYATEKCFGEGISKALYLVSRRFYDLLRMNDLDNDVSFIPVANVTLSD